MIELILNHLRKERGTLMSPLPSIAYLKAGTSTNEMNNGTIQYLSSTNVALANELISGPP